MNWQQMAMKVHRGQQSIDKKIRLPFCRMCMFLGEALDSGMSSSETVELRGEVECRILPASQESFSRPFHQARGSSRRQVRSEV